MNRLEQQWPDVHSRLTKLPTAQQYEVALRAATESLHAVGLPVPADDEAALERKVDHLDNIAWAIQETTDAQPGAYDHAFRMARAMNSYLLARFGDSPADALYEALHGLGAPTDAKSALRF
ncbi:MAG: hypothetical protein HZY73_07465 [Micropruina sp.]|nr:MAG: hypothetical protein HZY73_07465 [Micropruina sp.]